MPESAPAPPPGTSDSAVRRLAVRYRLGPVVRYLIRPGLETGEALVRELALDGCALVMTGPPRPGTVLLLQLPTVRPGASHTRLARVLHAGPEPGRTWLVGCQFTPPLEPADLAALRARFAAYE